MGTTWSQLVPPTPSLTEANLPKQTGKTFIVTGGTAGVGLQLCTMLYQAGGKVYICARSSNKAESAIAKIKELPGASNGGELKYLVFELDDLSTIKPAVETFTAAEDRLDVLFLNAGVSNPPAGSVGKQGHDLTMVTNCYGHHLLAQLLKPKLAQTAHKSTPGAVRVVWTASLMVELGAPKGGMTAADMSSTDPAKNYITSKTGNWFLADAMAKQVQKDGVLSVAQNPGNLKSELLRHFNAVVGWIVAPILYDAKYGAYTELWSGLSPDLVIEDGGKYVIPWGRLHPSPRQDLLDAMKMEAEGGNGIAAAFIEQCDREIKEYL